MKTRNHGRVAIRPIKKSDLGRIWKWISRDDVLDALLLRRKVTFAEQCRWYDSYLNDSTKKVFAIEYHGKHVGNVALFAIDRHHRRAMLNIFIGDDFMRGRDIGTKAVRAVLKLAFEKLGLDRISLEVLADNNRAVRCYEKSGFVREGILRAHSLLHGMRRDMFLFSCLKRDWLSASPRKN